MTPYILNVKIMFKQIRKAISIVVIAAFMGTSLNTSGLAQMAVDPMPHMSIPGVMVHLSPEFTPAYLKGIVIHPENALKFDFIIYKGDKELTDEQKRVEYTKLTKYFLASLAIPDDDQWVNLSPYEKDRIINDDFGKTEMGRDLLAQDYMLKQITASLIYPEDDLGKKFWDRVYSEAQQKYGTSHIPVNTFNKVWILPDDALIYEKGNTAYVLRNHLRVMLEEDYLALKKHSGIQSAPMDGRTHSIASKIVKEIILPELEREVNEGKNFAAVRQVYSGMLLATWYKHALKESLLSKIYANKGKVKGVDQDPQTNELIYRQYLRAYKKGVFNFIKEDVDKYTNEVIPRKYFSGGFVGYFRAANRDAVKIIHSLDGAQVAEVQKGLSNYDLAQIATEEREEVAAAANSTWEGEIGRQMSFIDGQNQYIMGLTFLKTDKEGEYRYTTGMGGESGTFSGSITIAGPGSSHIRLKATVSADGRVLIENLYRSTAPFTVIGARMMINVNGSDAAMKAEELAEKWSLGLTAAKVLSYGREATPSSAKFLSQKGRQRAVTIFHAAVLKADGKSGRALRDFIDGELERAYGTDSQYVKGAVHEMASHVAENNVDYPTVVGAVGLLTQPKFNMALTQRIENLRMMTSDLKKIVNEDTGSLRETALAELNEISFLDNPTGKLKEFFNKYKGLKGIDVVYNQPIYHQSLDAAMSHSALADLIYWNGESSKEERQRAGLKSRMLDNVEIGKSYRIYIKDGDAPYVRVLLSRSGHRFGLEFDRDSGLDYFEIPHVISLTPNPHRQKYSISYQDNYRNRSETHSIELNPEWITGIKEFNPNTGAVVDRAALARTPEKNPLGGIDMNSANLNLQIKRDGNGVPLPISQQDLENIHIDGLIPVIINIEPAVASSLLSELQLSGTPEQAAT